MILRWHGWALLVGHRQHASERVCFSTARLEIPSSQRLTINNCRLFWKNISSAAAENAADPGKRAYSLAQIWDQAWLARASSKRTSLLVATYHYLHLSHSMMPLEASSASGWKDQSWFPHLVIQETTSPLSLEIETLDKSGPLEVLTGG